MTIHDSRLPFFSVVIPCFNRAGTILKTLLSVKDQTFADFECIVVDDGSQDGLALQKVISDMNDDRFCYIRQENGGGGAARNTGIDAAKGKYIAFLDSDDFFRKDKLQRFAEIVGPNPKIGYYSKVSVDRGGDRLWLRPDRAIQQGENMGEYLFVYNQFIQTSTIVLAAETAKSVRFDPSLRKGQDLDFCVRLAAAGVLFLMLDDPLAIWMDDSEVNRTSRHAGYQAPILWLAKSEPLLTKRATQGYRATVLAYYLAREKPLVALKDLAIGLVAARVPPKVIARQFLRCFVPRHHYRIMANAFVALAGKPKRHGL